MAGLAPSRKVNNKALSAQRLGNSAIIIYGSLSSRYSLNYTNSSTSANDAKTRTNYYTNKDVIWPLNKYDYDCTYGRALLPTSVMNKLNFVTHSEALPKIGKSVNDWDIILYHFV